MVRLRLDFVKMKREIMRKIFFVLRVCKNGKFGVIVVKNFVFLKVSLWLVKCEIELVVDFL